MIYLDRGKSVSFPKSTEPRRGSYRAKVNTDILPFQLSEITHRFHVKSVILSVSFRQHHPAPVCYKTGV